MKIFNSEPVATGLCAAAFAVLSLAGCASAPYQKGDAAAQSLRAAAMNVQSENQAIDAAISALDDLVNKPDANLKPQFARFSRAVDRLSDRAADAEKASQAANQKIDDYVENWGGALTNITYGQIRDQSESRKQEVTARFDTVNGRYRENESVVRPLITYLNDIRTALSADLTAGGIRPVKEIAANAEQNARKVQAALAQLADQLTSAGAEMSSVVPEPAEAEGGSEGLEQQQAEDGVKFSNRLPRN